MPLAAGLSSSTVMGLNFSTNVHAAQTKERMKAKSERTDSQAIKHVAMTFAACTPLFFALGETGRQQILLLLTQSGEMNVNQLAERLPLSRPTISHHLKILRQAGLVAIRQAGVENYYAITADAALDLLKRFVAEVEASC